MRTLTKLGCKSAPPVINWKRETQYQDDLVPGGFVVYLVTGELPGILLTRDAYWDFTSEKRHEIREAFKKAYEYVSNLMDLIEPLLTVFCFIGTAWAMALFQSKVYWAPTCFGMRLTRKCESFWLIPLFQDISLADYGASQRNL